MSGGLRPNHQINVTVEHLQQGEQLMDRLAVVRLIEQTIQLRRRRSQPAHGLTLRERALCDSLLCFERQSVQQEIAEMCWILVVLEHRSTCTTPVRPEWRTSDTTYVRLMKGCEGAAAITASAASATWIRFRYASGEPAIERKARLWVLGGCTFFIVGAILDRHADVWSRARLSETQGCIPVISSYGAVARGVLFRADPAHDRGEHDQGDSPAN